MIGLVDLDLSLSTSESKLIPNIEIMKLANYYRKEENHFCRLINLEEKELDSYDKIYVFSELHPNFKMPDNFLLASNVIYGGSAFTKKYIPFDNKVIDYTLPTPTIYKELLKEKYNNGIKAKAISQMLDNTYYRNYAGDNKLPIPPVIPRKQVILYDKDFFYDDWEQTIEKISDRRPSKIIRLHPIVCHTLTEFFSLRAKSKIARDNEIILDINIPLSDTTHMFNKYKNKFLADVTQSSNIYLPLGGNWKSNLQYFRDFVYKMNLLYCFWSKGILLKIKFLEPDFGYTNPIYNLEKKTEIFTNRISKKTLNEKIIKKKKGVEEEEKDLFLSYYPKEENLFNQTFYKLLENGRWNI